MAGGVKGNTGGVWEQGVQRAYKRGVRGLWLGVQGGSVARGAKGHRWRAGVLQFGCGGTVVRGVGSAGYHG